jgi:hypothetical protein
LIGEANRRKEISARRLGILQPWLQRFVAAVKTLALTEETSRELLVEAGLFNTFICIITDVEVILLSQYHKESGRLSCSILPETYRSTKEAIESGPIWLFRNREGYLGRSTSPPFDFEGGLNSISGISGLQIRLADGEE